jgi:hypothetical protein
MTRLRRQRLPGRGKAWCAILFAALAAAGLWQAGAARAETTGQVQVDSNPGIAIRGFDPVSYFTEGEPQAGLQEHEFRHDGATWRFHSEANRAAFAKDPDLYMPRYGGHDPVAVGQGIARPGDPDFWAVRDKKLFLFQSEDAKRDFELDPRTMTMLAEACWPQVREMLAP